MERKGEMGRLGKIILDMGDRERREQRRERREVNLALLQNPPFPYYSTLPDTRGTYICKF